MNKIRIGGIVAATFIIIRYLTKVDYSNMNWSNNETSYGITICMIGFILSMVLSMKKEEKKY